MRQRQTGPSERIAVSLRLSLFFVSALLILHTPDTAAQIREAFAVASIRPSGAPVPFEHNGKTVTSSGSLRMQDVTVGTCIRWAYGVQRSQIVGPASLEQDHYDIEAKADGPVSDAELKRMMQALLADRFKLAFHHENKELKSFSLTLAKGESKLQPSKSPGESSRQNSATGTVAKSTTMQEFADFLSDPLNTPVVDRTGLEGRYDFVLDFTPYLPKDQSGERPDVAYVLNATLQGELGLKLEPQKELVQVMVIDHLEKPSEN